VLNELVVEHGPEEFQTTVKQSVAHVELNAQKLITLNGGPMEVLLSFESKQTSQPLWALVFFQSFLTA